MQDKTPHRANTLVEGERHVNTQTHPLKGKANEDIYITVQTNDKKLWPSFSLGMKTQICPTTWRPLECNKPKLHVCVSVRLCYETAECLAESFTGCVSLCAMKLAARLHCPAGLTHPPLNRLFLANQTCRLSLFSQDLWHLPAIKSCKCWCDRPHSLSQSHCSTHSKPEVLCCSGSQR